MAEFLNDTFTEGSDTTLASHTGEVGATWTQHPSNAGTFEVVASSDMVRPQGDSQSHFYYSSGVPASADYVITSVFQRVADEDRNHTMGVAARMSTSVATYYHLVVETFSNPHTLILIKVVTGSETTLGSYTIGNTNGTYTIVYTLTGNGHEVTVNGVSRISATDSSSPITAAGRVGFVAFDTAGASTGWHVSSLQAQTADVAAVVPWLAMAPPIPA